MQGVEKSHLNAAIAAGLTAFYDLMHSTVEDALRKIHLWQEGHPGHGRGPRNHYMPGTRSL